MLQRKAHTLHIWLTTLNKLDATTRPDTEILILFIALST